MKTVQCAACDGRGWTPLHWHGHKEGPKDGPDITTGGIWQQACDRCYGYGNHPENVKLFHQRVGKSLLAKMTRSRNIFEAAWWLNWWWNGVLIESITPRLLQLVAQGHSCAPASRCYPDGLVKRTAREVARSMSFSTEPNGTQA